MIKAEGSNRIPRFIDGPLKKLMTQIKQASSGEEFQAWYFDAILLTFPETMVINRQIQQALLVFEDDHPQELLTVILTQSSVRQYCNILKPFLKFRFCNGIVKKGYINTNYVQISQKSKIIRIGDRHGQNQEQQNEAIGKQRFPILKNDKKDVRKQMLSQRIINKIPQQFHNSSSLRFPQYHPLVLKSQGAKNRERFIVQDLISFCGTVIRFYDVGKGKINHGYGYKVQQFYSKVVFEVVIWSQVDLPKLKKGTRYEFKNFRKQQKANMQISYYSHYYFSQIVQVE